MTGPEQHADTVDMDRVAGRTAACQEDVAARPYSSPVAVGWYAEDVPALVALAERADTLERGPCRCDKCRDCVAADGYEAAVAAAEQARAEADRLREALRPIVKEYDLWAAEADDGEFRLWDLDRLVMAIVAARAALAGPQTKEQT